MKHKRYTKDGNLYRIIRESAPPHYYVVSLPQWYCSPPAFLKTREDLISQIVHLRLCGEFGWNEIKIQFADGKSYPIESIKDEVEEMIMKRFIK